MAQMQRQGQMQVEMRMQFEFGCRHKYRYRCRYKCSYFSMMGCRRRIRWPWRQNFGSAQEIHLVDKLIDVSFCSPGLIENFMLLDQDPARKRAKLPRRWAALMGLVQSIVSGHARRQTHSYPGSLGINFSRGKDHGKVRKLGITFLLLWQEQSFWLCWPTLQGWRWHMVMAMTTISTTMIWMVMSLRELMFLTNRDAFVHHDNADGAVQYRHEQGGTDHDTDDDCETSIATPCCPPLRSSILVLF